jgi:hypothetical protein
MPGLSALVPTTKCWGKRRTLGADKAYDATEFLNDLRGRSVTPHIARNDYVTKTGKRRKSAINGRTTRHAGYTISQRCRKRISHCGDRILMPLKIWCERFEWQTQADDLPSGRKIGTPKRAVCSVLLRLTALAGILRLLAGFLIWVLPLLVWLLIWILTLLAALVRIVSHRFDLHIGELAIVFRRAALAVSKDREFQETIRQHSSLDF